VSIFNWKTGICLFMLISLWGCARDFTNPFDPNSTATDEWAPSNLQASLIADNTVKLEWEKGSAYPVQFIIERRVNYGSFSELATIENQEYTDMDISRDNVYTYRIRALAGNNVSIGSNTQKLQWAEPGYLLWSLDSLVTSFHDTLSKMISVGFSHDGSLIATGEELQTRIWSAESGELIWFGRQNDEGNFIAFRPDDQLLQSGAATIDLQNFTPVANNLSGDIRLFKFLPDNSGYAYIWSKYFYLVFFNGLGEWGTFEEPYYYNFTCVDFDLEQDCLVNGSTSKLVRVYSIPDGDLIWTGTHPAAVTSVDYAPDGKTIVAGSEDGTIHVWNAIPAGNIGEILLTLRHSGAVNQVAYSANGTVIISGGADYTLRAWEATTGSLLWTVNTIKPVQQFFISSDDQFVVALVQDERQDSWSEVEDGTFAVWSLVDGTELWSGGSAIDIALSNGNDLIAAVTGSTLQVYSAQAKWIITE